MKKIMSCVSLALSFTLAVAAGASAKPKPKHSPAHDAAVKQCDEAYEAASRAAHAPNSPTGKQRLATMHAAAEAKKACLAKAPK